MERSHPDLDDPALESAKRIIAALLTIYKKINFYSATHSIYQEALQPFHRLLVDHIEGFGDIRFKFEQYQFLFEDAVIHEGESKSGDLAFILHRDGIKWIEFKNGLELWEIDTLIKTFNDCSHLEVDTEDDIATILWGLKLPSITYEVIDVVLDQGDDIDFKALPCSSPTQEEAPDAEEQQTSKTDSAEPDVPQPIQIPEFDRQDELFILTPEEQKQLKAMIADEEKLDGSDYVIDVFLYIIEQHLLSEDIDELIEDMTHAMHEALLTLRFSYLSASITKIKKQIDIFRSASHWSVPHLERFLSSLASESFLIDLSKITSKLEHSDLNTLKDLKTFLLLLDPNVIYPLAQIMVKIHSDKLQSFLQETIFLIAKQDFRPMKKLLFSSDKVLAGHLIFILRFFTDQHSRKVLIQLLKDDSELIRKQALKTLFARKEHAFKDIFFLIDDPDNRIRTLLLKHMGRERNEKSEQLLLDYLTSGQVHEKDPDHFKAVCRTLGRCGSERSLPFVKKMLFKWPKLGVLRYGNSVRRQGADTALKELNIEEADQLIKRSQKGFVKNFFRSA